jgi:hypothetical protein
MASIPELCKSTLPNWLNPIPHKDTLRTWFDKEKIPRFKASPLAKRGGGTVYYSVADVEKLLQRRTTKMP